MVNTSIATFSHREHTDLIFKSRKIYSKKIIHLSTSKMPYHLYTAHVIFLSKIDQKI